MVGYEWDCETQANGDSADHEDGETVEHSHGVSFRDVTEWAKKYPCAPGYKYVIVLVRDADCGPFETGRTWAHMAYGQLPVFFTNVSGNNATKVPQRFHREVAALALSRHTKPQSLLP